MTRIHMETEQTRHLVDLMNNCVVDLYDGQATLQNEVSRLSGAWDSPSCNEYVADARAILNALKKEIDRLDDLRRQLNMEIDQWIQTDSEGPVVGSGLLQAGLGLGGLATITAAGTVAYGFDWNQWKIEMTGVGIEKGFDVIRGIPYNSVANFDYRDIGRFINQHYHHDLHGGAVGRWDKVGHVIKSPGMKKWGIPIIGDIVTGLMEGEDLGGAILSGAVHAGIKTIPVVGTVLAVSNVVQLGGDLLSAGLAFAGYDEASATLQDTFDVIDLDGYVEQFSDDIADFVLHGDTTFEVGKQISDNVSKFSCGMDVDPITPVGVPI